MPPAEFLPSPLLYSVRLRVADRDVVWLRAVLEGYDGLGALYGDGSGIVTVTTTTSRALELDSLIGELSTEAALLRLD